MLHPEHYCSQRRVRGQSYWLGFLCKTLSFFVSSRFIPALSLTLFMLHCLRQIIVYLSKLDIIPRVKECKLDEPPPF